MGKSVVFGLRLRVLWKGVSMLLIEWNFICMILVYCYTFYYFDRCLDFLYIRWYFLYRCFFCNYGDSYIGNYYLGRDIYFGYDKV